MGCKNNNLHIMTSSWVVLLNFIIFRKVDIVDIELMFELICMFVCLFFVFLSSLQMIRTEETNNKTGKSTKLLLYYYTI